MEDMTLKTIDFFVARLIRFRSRMLSFWFAPTTRPPGGYGKNCQIAVTSKSLVLDEEKGELKAEGKVVGGNKGEGKCVAALKSHSEAERRRRERINAHLEKLRGLVPFTEKMDKATLLAEVIRHVKQLNKSATQASEGLLIPEDADDVRVEQLEGSSTFRASLCCRFRPELLTDLRKSLDALNLNIVRAELSTLEGRVKNVFDFTSNNTDMPGELVINSVREAISAVVDKASISPEYWPRTTLPNKRRRFSIYDNWSSTS